MTGSFDPPRDPLIGRTIGGTYSLDAFVGQGGMGAVYLATHLALGTACAVKVLRPDRASDPATARRFVREAKQTFHFDDPHCVRVLDFGIAEDDLLYLVMELIDGRTLGEELRIDGSMSSPRVCHIGAQIAQALACAHRRGFVHRDLKPENVMLMHHQGDPDYAKVLDFGLAKIFDARAAEVGVSVASLTQDGVIFGTPEYMSPEQAMGLPLDPRSDLYSLGVLLFEAVTGELPFHGATPMALLVKHVKERPPKASMVARFAIAPELETLISACLAKKPNHRPGGADEVARRLREAEPWANLHWQASHRDARNVSHAPLPETAALSSPRLPDPSVSAVVGSVARSVPAGAAARGIETQAIVEATFGGQKRAARRAAGALLLAACVALGWVLFRSSDVPLATTSPLVAAREEPLAEPGVPSGPLRPPAADVTLDAALGRTETRADAGPSARSSASQDHSGVSKKARMDRKVSELLAKSEEARRLGERLAQMAAADEALRLAPKHSRAAFLLGEALLEQGDPGAGCSYLRRAGSSTEAKALMRTGCPSD